MCQRTQAQQGTNPPLSIRSQNPQGQMGSKRVVEAKNQTSKAWFILAVVVGSAVLVGAGGFGAVGLLQSHGVISLPQSMQWLSSAIGTVGNTPHFWSLWTMTGGALLMGGALIAMGSRKIHQIRKEEAHIKKEKEQKLKEAAEALQKEQQMWAQFTPAGQSTAKYCRDNKYGELDKYAILKYPPKSPEEKNIWVIACTRNGLLVAADHITQEAVTELAKFLREKGYTENIYKPQQ